MTGQFSSPKNVLVYIPQLHSEGQSVLPLRSFPCGHSFIHLFFIEHSNMPRIILGAKDIVVNKIGRNSILRKLPF